MTSALLDGLESVFGSDDLYEVLEVKPKASKKQLRKAYFVLARRFHPDKFPDDEDALVKFQLLSRVYSILSDEHKRKVYDGTGSVEEDALSADPSFSWSAYWRELFPAVDDAKIMSFADCYRGSNEEKEDLKKAYLKFKGDMTNVFDSIMLSNPLEDEERFRKLIDEMIDRDEVPFFKPYHDQAARDEREKKATEEAVEANKVKSKRDALLKRLKNKRKSSSSSKSSGGNDLASAILQRQESRKNHFASLERKYSKGKAKRSVPSEEEFQRIQQELEAKKSKRKEEKQNRNKEAKGVVQTKNKKKKPSGGKTKISTTKKKR
eukprot:m.244567 g.244567  ORF g.244567 m.244567 type:complete len:321 (+) comp54414_c0_seq1:58-1020(+)